MCGLITGEIKMKENCDKLIWLSKNVLITILYMRYLAFMLKYIAMKNNYTYH